MSGSISFSGPFPPPQIACGGCGRILSDEAGRFVSPCRCYPPHVQTEIAAIRAAAKEERSMAEAAEARAAVAQQERLEAIAALAAAERRLLPWDYKRQPNNEIAWRIGMACTTAERGGDPIDHGLSLLQKLQEKGLGIVALSRVEQEGPG